MPSGCCRNTLSVAKPWALVPVALCSEPLGRSTLVTVVVSTLRPLRLPPTLYEYLPGAVKVVAGVGGDDGCAVDRGVTTPWFRKAALDAVGPGDACVAAPDPAPAALIALATVVVTPAGE